MTFYVFLFFVKKSVKLINFLFKKHTALLLLLFLKFKWPREKDENANVISFCSYFNYNYLKCTQASESLFCNQLCVVAVIAFVCVTFKIHFFLRSRQHFFISLTN